MEKLNVKSLELALASLKSAWDEYNKEKNEYVRDSVIHRFEYTFAISIKYMQRYLELNIPNPDEVDYFTFNELIRTSNEKGILLRDLEDWEIYRQRRNVTSHTYNQEKAMAVLEIIPKFIEDVKYLINSIK